MSPLTPSPRRLALRLAVTVACAACWPVTATAQPDEGARAPATLRERLQQRQAQRQHTEPARQAIDSPGDHELTLTHAGRVRKALVHVPRSLDRSRPAPLVLAFHGGGGDMAIQADDRFYGWISKSDAAGFVVVFPNGTSRLPSGKLATWNAGRCCGHARDQQVDDVGFVRALVEQLSGQLAIDRTRVFATGMSNGGMLAYRLACDAPDLVRAIASVAGTDNTEACNPKTPVSVLHIHARDDERVLFNGGAGQPTPQVTAFTSVPATVAKWVGLNACSAAPRRVFDREGATCDAYAACRDATTVQLCVTATGGHSWPGGQKPRGNGTPSTALNATDVIWGFFAGQ